MKQSISTPHLYGKRVVVIGGSRGLGRAIVAATHAQEAQVLAVARQEESLKKLADEFPGVHILALAPGGLMPETDLGKAGVEAYASSVGLSSTDFLKRRGSSQTPEDVANAVVEFAINPRSREGNVFLVSGKGIEALP